MNTTGHTIWFVGGSVMLSEEGSRIYGKCDLRQPKGEEDKPGPSHPSVGETKDIFVTWLMWGFEENV